MDLNFLDIFDFRNIARINLGLLWIGLGRFLVLGSSWKCFSNAVACINHSFTLYFSIRKKIYFNLMGNNSIYINIYAKYVWNIFSKIRNFKFCSYICQWSWKRVIYTSFFIYFDFFIYFNFFLFSQSWSQKILQLFLVEQRNFNFN